MRKALIAHEKQNATKSTAWLDLAAISSVEITSEDEQQPIEQALTPGGGGWRAAAKGSQIVRVRFDQPAAVGTIQLHIIEKTAERNQELAIYAKTSGAEFREIVRQQFAFSPHGSTEEFEVFKVDLEAGEVLELRIDPDRAHNPADSAHYATLASLKVG